MRCRPLMRCLSVRILIHIPTITFNDMADINELLLTVRKPGRYVGGEWNAVKKEWTADKVKFLLAFPDTYEIGMSHLGIKILYGILNDRQDALCERVFAPWSDLEKVLRDNAIPDRKSACRERVSSPV